MKFRKLEDLTDEEIRFIFLKINPEYKNIQIKRNENEYLDEKEIIIIAESEWTADDEKNTHWLKEEFELTYDGIRSSDTYDFDDRKNELIYQKWLLSKGCNMLLKDNEFLENTQ